MQHTNKVAKNKQGPDPCVLELGEFGLYSGINRKSLKGFKQGDAVTVVVLFVFRQFYRDIINRYT